MTGLRQAGTRSLEEANRYLEEEFLKDWNERFTVQAGSEMDAHRPLGERLEMESILSHVEQRQVTNDYTVAWEGQRWQIPKEAVVAGLRRSTIRVEGRMDGTLRGRVGDRFVAVKARKKPRSKRSGQPGALYGRPARAIGWIISV